MGRRELSGWTSLDLKLSKNATTNSASIGVFLGYMPDGPILDEVVRGQEVLVYVGSNLVFTGSIDRRKDEGDVSLEVGDDSYSVTLDCRGKAKALVDESYQGATTVLDTTDRQEIERLVSSLGLQLVWDAAETALSRVRYRNGAAVFKEIDRLAENSALYFYEDELGRVVVTDNATAADLGDNIVLGENVLSFNASQLGDKERAAIKVKGVENVKGSWGRAAVVGRQALLQDDASKNKAAVTVNVFGNADDTTLQRRAAYEGNKQASLTKNITVNVFGVCQTDNEAWRVGGKHFVSLPPAGVSGVFEITDVAYTVQSDAKLTTKLTFSPEPAASGAAQSTGLASLDALGDVATTALNLASGLTDSWLASEVNLADVLVSVGSDLLGTLDNNTLADPPTKLRD